MNLTPLTELPEWQLFVQLVHGLEQRCLTQLRQEVDEDANRELIWLSELKAEVTARTRTSNPWRLDDVRRDNPENS